MNTIYRQFSEKCFQNPRNTAIITEEREYSYQQFWIDVENIADILTTSYSAGRKECTTAEREQCIGAQREQSTGTQHEHCTRQEREQCTIAVFMERGYQLLVAIWAIIRINGTYVPIDTTLNKERIRYVLADSEVTIILTDEKNSDTLSEIAGNIQTLILEDGPEELKSPLDLGTAMNPLHNSLLVTDPPLTSISAWKGSEYAYIIYTSGSTGQPKGILINEKALASFVENFRRVLPEDGFTRILAQTSISFDISLVELVYPFTVGKTVVIAEKMQAWNIKTVQRIIATYAIDCLQMTPSLISLLLMGKDAAEKLKCVKTLLVGGEVFSQTLLQRAQQTLECKIFNLYGPTEATVWCTAAELTGALEPVIGTSFGTNTVFLLDEQNTVVSESAKPGEICIAGSQLSPGYVHRPELTTQCFIDNPAIHGERFYKTGDMAQYDNQGNIIYLGRRDNQIKIDGRRIELEDVEECIKKLHWVQDVVVCVVTAENGKSGSSHSENTKYLRSFYVADREYDVSEIKLALKEHLPPYMIPKEFCRIDKIPLTISGKKDRNALVKHE